MQAETGRARGRDSVDGRRERADRIGELRARPAHGRGEEARRSLAQHPLRGARERARELRGWRRHELAVEVQIEEARRHDESRARDRAPIGAQRLLGCGAAGDAPVLDEQRGAAHRVASGSTSSAPVIASFVI